MSVGDKIAVLPTAAATPEVMLRYILERRDRFRGLCLVTIDHEGLAKVWVANGINHAEVALAGTMLIREALESE